MCKAQQNSSILTFRVGSFHFCVNAVEAEAIIETPQISSVPMMPTSIAGIFAYRGEVAVAISLRNKFGLQVPDEKSSGQIILTRINSELKGFQVDEVLDLNDDPNLIEQTLPYFDSNSIVNHLILKNNNILLHTDFERLFNAPDSKKLRSLLTAITGGRQKNPSSESRPNEDLPAKSAVQAFETKNPDDHPGSRQIDALKHEENLSDFNKKSDHRSQEARVSKSERKTASVVFFQKNEKKQDYSTKAKKIAHSGIGAVSGGNFRPTGHLELNQAIDLNKRRCDATDNRVYASRISRKTRQDRSRIATKNRFGWKILTSACLLFFISGALALWLWPTSRLENRVPLVDKAAAIETTDSNSSLSVRMPEKMQKPLQIPSSGTKIENELRKDIIDSASPRDPAIENVNSKQAANPIQNAKQHAIVETEKISPSLPAVKEFSNEVLRVETEDFTLMIERPVSPLPATERKEIATQTTAGETIHVVVRGDTLWHIAKGYLGDPFRYPELARLSRIKDPDWIYPGDLIRIIRKKTSKKRTSQG